METSNGQTGRSRWTRARDLAGLTVSWGLWTALTIGLVLYVRHYSRNIPFSDEFDIVPVMTGVEPVTVRWTWAQHNEHRIMIPRLMMVGLFRFVSADFRVVRYANAGLLSAMAACMLLVARRVRGSARLTDAVLPLAILSLAQGESLLNGYAMALVLTSGVAVALIAAAASERGGDGRVIALTFGVALVLLPLCGGAGVAMLPPLVLWLAGFVAWGWWSARRPAAWLRAVGAGLLLAGSAVVALYLRGYTRPVHHPLPPSARAVASSAVKYLSLTVYPSMRGHARPAGAIAVILVMATLLRLAIVSARSSAERPRPSGSWRSSSRCSPWRPAWASRAGLGPDAALASRYVSLGMPLFCALYVAWLAYGNTITRIGVPLVLCAMIVLALPGSYRFGRWYGAYVHKAVRRVERSVMDREADSVILDRMCPAVYPHRESAGIYLKLLEEARFGPFAELQSRRVATVPERAGPVIR